MIDFATSNVDLGRFNPNANVGLRAMVYLPGLGTGNEFQGKEVDVKWIFIAQADAPPRPEPPGPSRPESPYEPPVIITPVTPLSTVVPEEPPMEPEEPEEEVIIDAEIPEGAPNIGLEDEEMIEEETPQDKPSGLSMPKTGEASSMIYYVLGSGFLLLGFVFRRKNR